MEIGPIFRALINQRSRFWLITIEIALTLAVVTNCITMIRDQRASMLRPTGMDVDNILVVRTEPFSTFSRSFPSRRQHHTNTPNTRFCPKNRSTL